MAQRVVVVGAGVIGLSCARALAGRGVAVTVLDGSPGPKEASWAAAGILGVGTEYQADTPTFRLAVDAHRAWPSVVAELERETGVPLGHRTTGTMLVALEAADLPPLEARLALLPAHGVRAELLSGEEARRREPRIAPAARAALWIGEGRLDNRALWTALEASCRRRGVDLRPNMLVAAVEEEGGRVAGVDTPEGRVPADAVVLAAGAWTEALARLAGLSLPSMPVKGQLVRLSAPEGWLGHVVKRALHYVVPWAGQGLVVGTTAEEVGFDRRVEEEALAGILGGASRIVPGIAPLPRTESWMGFRPRLADGVPAIGAVAGRPGLFLATGHYRNGILLCEATGRLIARAVRGEPDPLLPAFSPDRFRGHAPHP